MLPEQQQQQQQNCGENMRVSNVYNQGSRQIKKNRMSGVQPND